MMERKQKTMIIELKFRGRDVLQTIIILVFLIDVDKLFSVQEIGSFKKEGNTSTEYFKFISFRSESTNVIFQFSFDQFSLKC